MDAEIRPVRAPEFDRVGDLVVDAYAAMTELGDYEAVLRRVAHRSRRAEVIVAILEGSVAGTVTYVPGLGPYAEGDDPDAAWIRMLAVDPAFRGQGIGTALVEWCVRRARATRRRPLDPPHHRPHDRRAADLHPPRVQPRCRAGLAARRRALAARLPDGAGRLHLRVTAAGDGG